MTISPDLWQQVRQRAKFTCEYCGVTETDTGGILTVDHFRPQAGGGTDDFENLIYCCFRCNLYKASYWPLQAGDPLLWNPRETARDSHLLLLQNGKLLPITPSGAFTIERLRLNRPALVAYRLRAALRAEEEQLLTQYRAVLELLEQIRFQQAALLEEQRTLLEEQRKWLQLLLRPEA
jgi:hypothetical protein